MDKLTSQLENFFDTGEEGEGAQPMAAHPEESQPVDHQPEEDKDDLLMDDGGDPSNAEGD